MFSAGHLTNGLSGPWVFALRLVPVPTFLSRGSRCHAGWERHGGASADRAICRSATRKQRDYLDENHQSAWTRVAPALMWGVERIFFFRHTRVYKRTSQHWRYR